MSLLVSGAGGVSSPSAAAKAAGYRQPAPVATRLMRSAHIIAAIRQERARLFDGNLATVAAHTLRAVMEDDQAPASARVAAARTVLEITRELGRRQDGGDGPVRQLHEMTPEELSALIDKWESERSSVARDITDQVDVVVGQGHQGQGQGHQGQGHQDQGQGHQGQGHQGQGALSAE